MATQRLVSSLQDGPPFPNRGWAASLLLEGRHDLL